MAGGKLTIEKIDALKARAKPYKVSDGGGLYLLVTQSGSKLWRLAYRFGDPAKQKTLALGVYDENTNGLLEARARASAAKLILKSGRDPGRTAPAADGQTTFKQAALAWHRRNAPGWAPKYAALILSRLEDDLFPDLGHLALASITRDDIESALARVVDRGAIETAHRINRYISCVFNDADVCADPTPRVRLKPAPKSKRYKRLKADEVGRFLVALDASTCEPETRLAMLLTIYTGARTSEVIGARWAEFEQLRSPRNAIWRLPPERMKAKEEHLVPLSSQVQALLADLRKRTGDREYLFPAADGRSGHMSNNTMLFHCYAMGYRNKTTMHGFRGVFSTYARESGLWKAEWIEVQLAHRVGNKVSRSYDSAIYEKQRRKLLQWWGDELDAMRATAVHWTAPGKLFG